MHETWQHFLRERPILTDQLLTGKQAFWIRHLDRGQPKNGGQPKNPALSWFTDSIRIQTQILRSNFRFF